MDGFAVQAPQMAFVVFCLLAAIAAIYDVWKFVIPNTVSLAVILLFFATVPFVDGPVDWLSHLGAALAVLLVGLVVYRVGFVGAGDVKLMAAASLWVGFGELAGYLIIVAVCGGGLAALLWILRRLIVSLLTYGLASPGQITLPRVLVLNEQIPYGVAIAGAAVFMVNELPLLGAPF